VFLDEAFLLEQRLEHALDGVGGPKRLLEARTPATRCDDRELARTNRVETAPVEDERNTGPEERLADDEAAAPADLDDKAVRQVEGLDAQESTQREP
jgi:hypothetical protein